MRCINITTPQQEEFRIFKTDFGIFRVKLDKGNNIEIESCYTTIFGEISWMDFGIVSKKDFKIFLENNNGIEIDYVK